MDAQNLAELAVTLFEEGGDALVLFDPDTEQILNVNPMAQRLSGFTRKELLHMVASYLFRSEDQGGLARLRQAIHKTEVFHSRDGYLLRHKSDGMWIPVNLTLARLHVQPRTLGLITARDVQEQREAHARTKKAEERLRTVVAGAPVILFALDRAGVFTFIDGKGLRALDLSADELLGHSIYAANRHTPQILKNVARVLAGEEWTEIVHVSNGAGAGRFFETHAVPLRDAHQQVIGAIGVATDITERQQAEQALRDSEAFYHSLVENLPQNILRKDVHGRFTFANQRVCTTLGKSLAEILGKTDLDLFPAALATKYRRDDERVMARGEPLEMVEEHVTPQGDRLYVQIIKSPLTNAERKTIGVQVIFWDVTRQKLADDQLRQSEERFRRLVEGVKDYAIFMLDPDGCIATWNEGAQRIEGYHAGEIIGRHVSCFYPQEGYPPGKADGDLQWAAKQECYEDENWRLRKDGSKYWANVVTTALHNEAGQLQGFTVIVRDLTERRRAEEVRRSLRAHEVESDVARQIQHKLFPTAPPRLPGFDIGGISCSAVATGGDYYDYVPMLDGGLGVVIGDAAGHGAGPALLMASTRAYLRSLALTHKDVGTILTLANQVLAADVGDRFVTLILTRLDPGTGSLSYASAGHHPPGCLLDHSGAVKLLLQSTGLPLGVVADAAFSQAPPLALSPGEIVLLLTDGIVEAAAPDGSAFGFERARQVVYANRQRSAQEIAAALYLAVCSFCADTPPLDDITAVLIKVDS